MSAYNSVSSYGRSRKRVKVVHRQSPYDVSVRSVILNNNNNLIEESKNILEGEILMDKDGDRNLYLSSHRHVHSDQRAWLDVVYDSSNANADDDLLKEKLEKLRYAGIAVTGFNQKSDLYQQGFMSTIGGTQSIMNTGSNSLRNGEEVYALPTKTVKGKHDPNYKNKIIGVPSDKQLFALSHEDGDAYKAALGVLSGSAEQKRLKLRKFCIGTVLKGGRRGQLIDVVLHGGASVIVV